MTSLGQIKRLTDLVRLATGKKTSRTPEEIRAAEKAAAARSPAPKQVGEKGASSE